MRRLWGRSNSVSTLIGFSFQNKIFHSDWKCLEKSICNQLRTFMNPSVLRAKNYSSLTDPEPSLLCYPQPLGDSRQHCPMHFLPSEVKPLLQTPCIQICRTWNDQYFRLVYDSSQVGIINLCSYFITWPDFLA